MQMYTGTRLTMAIHRRLLSRFLLREGGTSEQRLGHICDINSGTEKRGLKAYPSPSLRVASVIVSNCNASYWHVLAFNSCV